MMEAARSFIGQRVAVWSQNDNQVIGTEMKIEPGYKGFAICKANYGYTHCLTVGKVYHVSAEEGLLPDRDLVRFDGDDGRAHYAWAIRFDTIDNGVMK